MKGHVRRGFATIITKDGHRWELDFRRERVILDKASLLDRRVHDGLATDGALIRSHFSQDTIEALAMKAMTAWQDVRRNARVKHILEADRTILSQVGLATLVVPPQARGKTHTTGVAVKKVLPSAHATDATLVTVKRAFGRALKGPKVTHGAEIIPHDLGTIGVRALESRRLDGLARETPHVGDRVTVDWMSRLGFIMTKTTRVPLSTTRTSDLTPTIVMRAS